VHRRVGAGRHHVGQPDGVPVHGGVVEAGQRHLRGHRLRGGQAQRVEQRLAGDVEGRDGGQHPLEVLLDGDRLLVGHPGLRRRR
jgi:hypothetical protein